MASKFYALLTTRGEAKLAQAVALGTQLKITQMAVGDGGGVLPTPNGSQTKLVNQVRIAAINTLSVDPVNVSQIIAEQVIPENEGGWWIREIGLFDDAGELIAVANCAETYKPLLAEGSGRTQVIRMIIAVSSTDAVSLKIDPSVVLATRKYVDDKVIEVKAYADSMMKAHLDATDPHPQYAPKANPTFTGTPKAPTPVTGNNSTQLATTQFVQLAIAALVDSSPAALDTLKELADALGNDPNFAATMTNQLALKAPIAGPTFTGVPKAPTAAVGNNTTQLATTAFVQAAVAALVASSPAALDTLKELADALGNDPNFATTVMNALAGKAALAGSTTQKFWVLSAPGDNNAAVPVSLLNSGLASKAGLNGDSNQTFYAQTNDGATAVVNNTRLGNVLGGFAYRGGDPSQGFAVAGGTGANSAVAYGQFQSGTNGNGAWTKLPGGGQWCRQNLTLAANATTTWTYPTGFVAAPAVFITAINGAFSCWLNGIGPGNCGIYNNGPALNVNLYAVW